MAKLKIGKSCGSCLYFRHQIPDNEPTTHEKAGYRPYDKPCTMYEPATPLLRGNDKALSALSAIKDICDAADNPETLEAVAQMLVRSATLKAAGFRFLQKMFFRWRGQDHTDNDYLDNWVTGYLLNIAGNKTFWLTTADNGTVIAAPKNRCLTVSQFRPIYRRLVEEGRLNDKSYQPVKKLQGEPDREGFDSTAVRSINEIIGAINLEGLNIRSLKLLRQEEKKALQAKTASGKKKRKTNRQKANSLTGHGRSTRRYSQLEIGGEIEQNPPTPNQLRFRNERD
jgi:hypothetical protein